MTIPIRNLKSNYLARSNELDFLLVATQQSRIATEAGKF